MQALDECDLDSSTDAIQTWRLRKCIDTGEGLTALPPIQLNSSTCRTLSIAGDVRIAPLERFGPPGPDRRRGLRLVADHKHSPLPADACAALFNSLCRKEVDMKFQAIPIIRIFDEQKAKEFYLGFLGMNLDWEHRFEADSPVYMQVSRGNLVFHLSEHSGDCTPGSKVFVNTNELDELHQEITSKGYKYNRPEIAAAPWGDRVLEVIDPFSNKVLFNEPTAPR